MFAFLQPTYLPVTNSTSKNDQSNGPYSANQKNHPSHNGHVEVNLSKMTKLSFLRLFKLGNFY
jgi:hypothetical protein